MEDVDNYPCVTSACRRKAPFTTYYISVLIGKAIYLPMLGNATDYLFRIVLRQRLQPPTSEIGD